MDDQILISVIMPALNEEKKIINALTSIRNQTIDKNKIEILVIDGGSNDNTIKIAKNFEAKIINNIKIVPEEAKLLGIQNAAGKYIVFMDADEELTDEDQLNKRIKMFQDNPEVKAILVDGYNTPKGYSGLTRYTNSFGDPFSFFIYRLDNENLSNSLKKRNYKVNHLNDRILFYTQNNIIPIGDGGTTMIDLEYAKLKINNLFTDISIATTIFHKVVEISGCFGIIKEDRINHYTTISFGTLIRKIQFRVLNNLTPKENMCGFTTRADRDKKLNSRKYLFVLYCLLPPIVLLDTIIISFNKKCFAFLFHIVFVYYTIFQILFFGFLKITGKFNVLNKLSRNYPNR